MYTGTMRHVMMKAVAVNGSPRMEKGRTEMVLVPDAIIVPLIGEDELRDALNRMM